MNTFITRAREIIELIYFASGPVIAVLAAWGLRQITVTKNNARLASKREAFRLSAEQCVRYFDVIIPKINQYNDMCKRIPWEWFDKTKVEISDKGFTMHAYGKLGFDDALIPRLASAVDVLNCLESFAVFFTSGVAAEQIAFTSVGATYCSEVKSLLPLLDLLSSDKRHFKHLLALFFLWNNRFEKERLIMNKEQLEEKIKQIEGKTITPLGTDK